MGYNFLIGFAILINWDVASSATLVTHCDLPGPALKSYYQKDADSCKASCEASESCKAYSFISGWNRCFFKDATQRQVKLRIHAAAITVDAKTRTIGIPMLDTDIPGKDLRKVTGIASADACGEKCVDEPKCVAYSYLEGYSVCWLKDRLTPHQKKIFYCGFK